MKLLLFVFLTSLCALAFPVGADHLRTFGYFNTAFAVESIGAALCIAGATATVSASGNERRLLPRIVAGIQTLLGACAFSQVFGRPDLTFMQAVPSTVAAGSLLICTLKVWFGLPNGVVQSRGKSFDP